VRKSAVVSGLDSVGRELQSIKNLVIGEEEERDLYMLRELAEKFRDSSNMDRPTYEIKPEGYSGGTNKGLKSNILLDHSRTKIIYASENHLHIYNLFPDMKDPMIKQSLENISLSDEDKKDAYMVEKHRNQMNSILTESIEFTTNEYNLEKLSLKDKFSRIWLNPGSPIVYLMVLIKQNF
jgi:hypothetical protein